MKKVQRFTKPRAFTSVAVAATLLLLVFVAQSAHAAFEGHNGSIAYVHVEPDESGQVSFAAKEIYTRDADGSNPTRLTTNSSPEDYPAFSRDGEMIVFVSTRDGNPEIYVMNSDGSNQTRLTNSPGAELYPAFAPDGKKIVFASFISGIGTDIYLMDVDGSNVTRLTDNPALDTMPAFSPDGKRIAFQSSRDGIFGIYTMKDDGSHATQVTNHRTDRRPEFSPDGKYIVFDSLRPEDPEGDIYMVRFDGTELTRLTNNTTNPAGRRSDLHPAFSSDGTKIIFTSNRDGRDQLYVMNRDGSGQTNITNSPNWELFPDWGPLPKAER